MDEKFSKSLVRADIPEALKQKREEARAAGVPVADDETLQYLLFTVLTLQPKRILEIGTAVGLSGAAMLLKKNDARLTTIEIDESSYLAAKENFRFFGVEDRVNAYLGDAGEILSAMPREINGAFDLVFLDGPKAQYIKYLPEIKRLLRAGGVLLSDDILLYGWVDGEPPKKRHMLVEKIRGYLRVLCADKEFLTSILPLGDGLAVSVKR
ncbi:MAG: O-methyltransferase [Candidatus Borkfalkiaceae bacterium]|nr:O-methyltransferase [Clostridia bacterium]MDY6224131.1 O-methyltransferase [Christensenellaceae bacterium]